MVAGDSGFDPVHGVARSAGTALAVGIEAGVGIAADDYFAAEHNDTERVEQLGSDTGADVQHACKDDYRFHDALESVPFEIPTAVAVAELVGSILPLCSIGHPVGTISPDWVGFSDNQTAAAEEHDCCMMQVVPHARQCYVFPFERLLLTRSTVRKTQQ